MYGVFIFPVSYLITAIKKRFPSRSFVRSFVHFNFRILLARLGIIYISAENKPAFLSLSEKIGDLHVGVFGKNRLFQLDIFRIHFS